MCKADVFSHQTIYTISFTFLQAVYTLQDQIHSDNFSRRTSTLITQNRSSKTECTCSVLSFELGTQTALKTSDKLCAMSALLQHPSTTPGS